MSLVPFFFVSLSMYALLAFAAIPRLEHRLRLERTALNIRYAALLAVLGVAHSACLIATLTSGMLAIAVYLLLQIQPGVTPIEIGQAIGTLQTWRASLVGFGPYWGSVVALVLVVSLGGFAYRSGKRRMEKAFSVVFDREFERIRQEAEAGRLEPLPETAEMQALSRKIEEVKQRLESTIEANNIPNSIREQTQRQLEEQISLVENYYVFLDVRRRMDLRLDPDEAAFPRPRNWWERVQTFLISRGLFSSLKTGSQILYMASIILLVPCLMGLYSPSIGSRLATQIVEFKNLEIDFSQQEALADWNHAERELLAQQHKVEAEAAEEQQREGRQAQYYQHQTTRVLLRTAHDAELKFARGRQARTLEPEAVRQTTMHALEQRQADELNALVAQQAQEQEALQQHQAKQAQQQQQRRIAQEEELANRQRAERGRSVPSKVASRNHTSPQQWQETQFAVMQRKLKAETDQVKQRLQAETEAAKSSDAVKAGDRIAELNRSEAAERFQEIKGKLGPPTSQLTEADQAVLREAARNYERAGAASWQDMVPEHLTSHEVKALAARNQILRRAADHSPTRPTGPGLQAQPSMSRISDLRPEQKFVLQAAEQLVDPQTGLSEIGQRAYTHLEDVAQRKPSLIGMLRQQLHTFQEPVSRRALSNRLMTNAMAMFLSIQSPELGVLVHGVEREVNRVAIERVLDTRLQESITDLLEHHNLESALEKMAQVNADHPVVPPSEQKRLKESMRVVFERVPSGQKVAEAVRPHPPSVADIPEPHVKLQQAGEYIAGLSRRLDPEQPAAITLRLSEPLNSYDDFFPGQLGAETRTPRGRILEDFGGFFPSGGVPGGGPGGGGSGLGSMGGKPTPPVSLPKQVQMTNFMRARSFGALRGFSRVGGVLIGQDPATDREEAMDFRDLRWEEHGSNLRILLIDAQGQVWRSRPFRKSLIYHALTYAADGRPLAVTMVKANPLPELRILLHPTLVDTPLGYRVVELDRFVDRFTGGEDFPARAEATRLVKSHEALYRLAWAQRNLVLLDNDGFQGAAKTFKVPDSVLNQLRAKAQKTLNDRELQLAGLLAIQEPQLLVDGGWSPLTVKKEFFDSTLVRLMTDSLVKGKTLREFLDRLQENAQTQILAMVWEYQKAWGVLQAARNEAEAKLRAAVVERAFRVMDRCMDPAPEFEVWSGVREQPYSVHLDALLPSDDRPIPMPFQFMLQVAFTSAPYFLADELNQEQLESYTDKTPWEFPALRDTIQQEVLEKVRNDVLDKAILDDTAEFTILQRLFRVILQGKLGKDFPMEKLVVLTDATAPTELTTRIRTPRWNSGAGWRALRMETVQVEQLTDLLEELEQLSSNQQDVQINQGLTILRVCRDLLEERGRHVSPLQQELERLLNAQQTKTHAVVDLQKYRALSDTWQEFQDDWLKRWAAKCDVHRVISQSGSSGSNAQPPGNDHTGLLQQVVRTTERLGLLLQVRHQLGIYVDDRQSLEELLRSRALPPL